MLQENMLPTHVVANYGLWLAGTDKECGLREGQACPYVPQVCEFLTGEHDFRVIWQTSTPKVHHTDTAGEIGMAHHLHIPRVCKLAPSAVINRGELLHALAPDAAERKELYHDETHFTPAPYHAFNGYLVEMIASQDLGHGQASQDGAVEKILEHQAGDDEQETVGVQEQSAVVQEQVVGVQQLAGVTDRLRAALG